MITRRDFLKLGMATAAGVMLRGLPWNNYVAYAFSQSANLRKFIQPLRMPGVDIPLAASDGTRTWGAVTANHYSLDIGQFEDQLHPDLPNPTRLWGYNPVGATQKHLGGIIVARKGAPVQITATNRLPSTHIMPIDKSRPYFPDALMQENAATLHLHGGFVPWISDGGPMTFFDPNGVYGPSAEFGGINIYKVLNPGLQPGQGEYYYPNNQSARLMWYHDHSHDTTRVNAYSGIATAYVITDDYEDALVAGHNLPGPLDPRTFYLVFQDKIFVQANTMQTDPTWNVPNSRAGDLWYAHVYDIEKYGDLGPAPLGPPADPSCVPEFFGDTMLVNGTVYPFLEVEQRQYRFRMLNACQARFLNPRLVYAKNSNHTEPNSTKLGPSFVQIGTEGGFLPQPAIVNGPNQPFVLMSPAERGDFIVDFRNIPAGTTFILYNDAPGPFPMGDSANDYYPDNPETPQSIQGFGPNTRTLLQIRVKARVGPADPPISFPHTFTPTDPFLIHQTPGVPTPVPNGVPVRRLTLNETFDGYGRLIQILGTDQAVNPGKKDLLFGRSYMDPVTEIIQAGSTEVWEIANLTGDTHPIHFHLTNVQLLSRQAFHAKQYAGGAPKLQGSPIAPDLNELGWKETVRMNPGEVTRVLMKFDLPSVPFTIPLSPRGGHEYVWHCHILEHEEHDMMRPLIIT